MEKFPDLNVECALLTLWDCNIPECQHSSQYFLTRREIVQEDFRLFCPTTTSSVV